MELQSITGRTIFVANKEYLYFAGTSYLGISTNEQFQSYLLEGFRKYGSNYGGSRLSNLKFSIFDEAEALIAKWTGAEAALIVSSGTLAGQLATKMLSQHSKLVHTPDAHPALFQTQQEASTLSYEVWVERVLERAHVSQYPLVFCCNAIDPLRLKTYDFSWLDELPKDKSFTLLLDDSHGIGITGQSGGGVFTTINAPEQVEVMVVASLGKALGISGGVILGKATQINQMKYNSFFGGASPASPAYLYAFLQAQQLYEAQRRHLLSLVHWFCAKCTIFRSLPDYPVFNTSHHHLFEYLQKKEIVISSFPYPTPDSERITRVVLNAAHHLDDVKKLVSEVNQL
jgi:7-keto-8-aminopelargonate synthetase-like enzyme